MNDQDLDRLSPATADTCGAPAVDADVMRRHFVAIATGEYDDPAYPTLPVADEVSHLRAWVADAEQLEGRAFTPAFPGLADNPDEDAILEAFRSLGRSWSERDAAVILVTGHGQVANDTHWLVLHNSESNELPSTAFRTGDLIRWLKRRNGIRHLLLIIDACFAGAIARDAIRIDDSLPPEWLILPSATKNGEATALALTTAIGQAIRNLRGGEGGRYGTNRRYFRVSDFIDTVRRFLGEQALGQELDPIYRGAFNAEHVCLPNPHYRTSDAVPTRPSRHELALPRQDLEQHWAPRAVGAGDSQHLGESMLPWLFTGRAALMRELIATARGDHDSDSRVTVITGAAGCGKSAVLARLVTLSDPDFAAAYASEVEAIPADLKPAVKTVLGGTGGGVDVAAVATNKYAHEVIDQLSDVVGAAQPKVDRGDADLRPRIDALIATLSRLATPVTMVVDALDEAKDPLAIASALVQVAQHTSLRLLIGVRSPGGPDNSLTTEDLKRPLADQLKVLMSARRLRVDEDPWWHQDDVLGYAKSILLHNPSSPYRDPSCHERAHQLSAAIAERVGRTFLVARLAATTLTRRPELADPANPAWLATLDENVIGVFREDLSRAFPERRVRLAAVELLRAVAFAYGKGLPWAEIWPLVANAVANRHTKFGDRDIADLLASPISAYLITDVEDETTVYRLFHDALRGTLRTRWRDLIGYNVDHETDETTAVEARITKTLHALTNDQDSTDLPPAPYLWRHLAEHAAAAGLIDKLLTDDAYLLHADLQRLLQAANSATSTQARRRARLLRLTPQAIPAKAAERAALFTVTEALEDLGTSYRQSNWSTSYRARWGQVKPRHERAFFAGHRGPVTGVCAVTVDGTPMLASSSKDRTVRIWDPTTGQQHGVFKGHQDYVTALCPVTVDGQPMLASGSRDDTVRIWDPTTGREHTVLHGHRDRVKAVCPVTVGGQPMLAVGSRDRTVRIWDPTTGRDHTALHSRRDWATAICPVTVGGQPMLAIGGSDGTVLIWDPTTGRWRTRLHGHHDWVLAVCPVTVDDQPMLASGSRDGTVRIWNPSTGRRHTCLRHHRDWVNALCPVTVGGQPMIASGSSDHTVLICDPATGRQDTRLQSHQSAINAMCTVAVGGQPMIASGSSDGTVRVWDPSTSQKSAPLQGRKNAVLAVCPVTVDGQPMLASAYSDRTMRIWDPATGEQDTRLQSYRTAVNAVCPVTVNGRPMLASACTDRTVRIWDLATGRQHTRLDGHRDRVLAVCPVTVDGQHMLASGSRDGTVRIWDPATGRQHARIYACRDWQHRWDWVNAVCPLTIGGQPMLATASRDGTVQIWNPATGHQRSQLTDRWDWGNHGHQDWVNALSPVTVGARPMLATGSRDGTVQTWDPATGRQHIRLHGHQDWVNALCPVTVGARPMLASGSADRTVRIWNPATGTSSATIATHYPVLALAEVEGLLLIGLETGLLAVEINLT